MIHIKKETIQNIPVLHVFQPENEHHLSPTVIYYHGYNGEKESSLSLAYKIAEKGYRVILPDSYLHGERQENIPQTKKDVAFWEIVIRNIKEMEQIKSHVVENGLSIADRIGIGGTSMGGITTFGALRQYEWIKAGAVLMGTPKMTALASHLITHVNEQSKQKITEAQANEAIVSIQPYDLSLQPDMLQDRSLLMWHGTEDQVVPFEHTKSFYEEIKPHYRGQLTFLPEKGRGHHISNFSIRETTKWFEKYL